jgi:hypothetical protein
MRCRDGFVVQAAWRLKCADNREVRRNRKVRLLSDRIDRVAFQVRLVLLLNLLTSHFVALTDLFGGVLSST